MTYVNHQRQTQCAVQLSSPRHYSIYRSHKKDNERRTFINRFVYFLKYFNATFHKKSLNTEKIKFYIKSQPRSIMTVISAGSGIFEMTAISKMRF